MCSSILIPTNSAYASGVDYSITVAPSLNVTIPSSSVILSLNPNTKTFAASEDFNVTVATNNPTGYELTMSSTSTSLNRDSSLDGKTATIDTLPTLAGGYDDTTFVANKWGYKKNNGNYFPLSVGGDQILKSYYPTSGDTTTLNFASKINNDQPAGSYSTTIAFTAVAYPMVQYIQDLNPAICTSSTPLTVIDRRDDKEYTVQRLADGNCWMTSNLNLAGGTKLYSETSDVPAGYSEQDGVGYYQLPASSTSGFSDDTKDYVYNTNNITNNQSDCTSSTPCNSYYSWLAATAGGKDASGNAVTGNGTDAPYSICPKGWRLPSSGNSGDSSAGSSTGYKKGDFYRLATAYGANLENQYYENASNFYNNAGPGTTPNFLLAGLYRNNSSNNTGSRGHYWSSSSNSSLNAYYLYFTSSNVSSSDYGNGRKQGMSVRCILNDTRTISDIAYMQDINTDIKNNTTNGTTAILTDKRDNKKYTVAKLNDGNIWMTSNLNLAGGAKLYSETSNVPAGYPESGGTGYYQLPASDTSGFSSDSTAYVYNTGNETTSQSDCTSSKPCNSYYSWLAATAGGKNSSGSNVTSNGSMAVYSICPKGWKLPSATTDGISRENDGYIGGDFYKLATQYGVSSSGYYQETSNFYNQAGPGTTPNFLFAGYYDADTFSEGMGSVAGYYWASNAYDSYEGYNLGLYTSRIYVAGHYGRRGGFSVRCLAAL